MASFRHQSLDRQGAVVNGVVVAPDRAAAIRQLTGRGQRPLQLEAMEPEAAPAAKSAPARTRREPSAGSFDFSALLGRRRASLKRTELANLIRELATALEAGLPLMQGMRTVRKQGAQRQQLVILDFLIEKVEAGLPLHQAMHDYGAPFDDMVVGMVRAADASGRMAEVLHQLADLLERSVELRRELVGATIYPMIVAGLILASVVVLVTFILPRLLEPLKNQPKMVMPWPTQVLLAFAGFMQSWWWAVLLAIVVGWVTWRYWVAKPGNRYLVDRLILRTPLVGPLIRDVAVARFTRTLGTLASAGLPILSALKIVRDTLGNTVLMTAIDQVQEKVTTGQSLAEPLERCGFFPPLLVQIVNIGERSGRLEPMLLHAATAFDRQVNSSLKVLTKALPPLLLVVMACLAAFVLSAILLPLMQLQAAMGG